MILALETSCDETAAAVYGQGRILGSEIASQIEAHRPFGGVVPELASRSHVEALRPVVEATMAAAGRRLDEMDAFAATSGPGLASSLLVGNTFSKGLALAHGKPFLSVNHLEGHLLSPFLAHDRRPEACLGLVVSGGHTLLVDVEGVGSYERIGTTRDDAAGEAFDKVAKMIGLPYPGGPEIDQLARTGDPKRFDLPRSMLNAEGFEFSFSGLKTSVFYLLPKLKDESRESWLPDLCASFQEAVVEVLVEKTVRAARSRNRNVVAVSGGVSCNGRLRERFEKRAAEAGIDLLLASASLSTDNAAMIAYAAALRLEQGTTSDLEEDVDPNLGLGAISRRN